MHLQTFFAAVQETRDALALVVYRNGFLLERIQTTDEMPVQRAWASFTTRATLIYALAMTG